MEQRPPFHLCDVLLAFIAINFLHSVCVQ